MSLTNEHLDQLSAPFPDDRIQIKVQSVDRDSNRAILVRYVRHEDVAERLGEVDPTWANKIHRVEVVPAGNDDEKEFAFVSMELTICGVTRSNVGEGKDPKSAASDALKRCAMSFGVGRYLYSGPKAWVEYDPSRDRHRRWTLVEYEQAIGQRVAREPSAPARARRPGNSPVKPVGNSRPAPSKAELVRKVRELQERMKISERDLISWARECAGVSPDKMDVSQLETFVGQLQFEARKEGHKV